MTILRVSVQNDLYYKTCLRYTILVVNHQFYRNQLLVWKVGNLTCAHLDCVTWTERTSFTTAVWWESTVRSETPTWPAWPTSGVSVMRNSSKCAMRTPCSRVRLATWCGDVTLTFGPQSLMKGTSIVASWLIRYVVVEEKVLVMGNSGNRRFLWWIVVVFGVLIEIFWGRQVCGRLNTMKLVLEWLPCQTPGVIGSVLGLVRLVSKDCGLARWYVWSAVSLSVWLQVFFFFRVRYDGCVD